MNNIKDKETIVIEQENERDVTIELSRYLDVLGSDVRLKILKLLQLEPADVETISSLLIRKFGKVSSRENTKRHVDKLLSIGVIKKQPAIRDNRAVINYVLVPGSIEFTMRTLTKVMKLDLSLDLRSRVTGIRERVSDEFGQSLATVKVLGGVDDGREFLIKKEDIRIGRFDPDNVDKYDRENDIVLSKEYRFVTRVSKPHAKLFFENGQWNIQHCEGRNPTYLWNRKLDKYKKEKLKNADIINLAKGEKGVSLVFHIPRAPKIGPKNARDQKSHVTNGKYHTNRIV